MKQRIARFAFRSLALLASSGALLASSAPAFAFPPQLHPEFVIGSDKSGKLVVRFDASKPSPLPVSRFPGIDGYAEGLPGFLSLLEPMPEAGLTPPDPSSHIVFVLVGADEGIGVLNDHGSASMKIGETFELGKPAFDSHPIWNIVNGETGKRYALRMRVRDTTGKHAESDVFAPEFTPDDSAVYYACPMQCNGGGTSPKPGDCAVCGMKLKLLSAKSYRVTVTPEGASPESRELRAGKPAQLRVQLATPDGEAVKKLEVVHEKLLHLLMVSSDLSWFAHEHPEIQPDGSLVLDYAFPHGGRFTLFNDFTPPNVGMQVVPVELDVAGERPAPVPLVASKDRVQLVDGYTVRLKAPATMRSIQMQPLTISIERDGKPVTDLEPFLGAMGHMIVISEDLKRFVHSHPLEPKQGDARASGPDVTFNAQFPAPGIYKAWGQVQHKGHVITASFVVDVIAPRAPAPAGSGTGGSRGQR